MGCSSSKQKKGNSSNFNDALIDASVPTIDHGLKSKLLKTNRRAQNSKSNIKNDNEMVGSSDEKFDYGGESYVQRSITPPIQSSAPSSQTESKSSKPSKSTRRLFKTWTDEELLAQLKFLDSDTSSNIVRMFDEGNTIPFMCRYRRELIGNRNADE